MNLEYLEWDSAFLKMKVGKINMKNPNCSSLKQILSENDTFDLVYIFSSSPLNIDCNKDVNLVDIKVTYKLDLTKNSTSIYNIVNDDNIKEYNYSYLVPELESLAYKSGQYSRFKTDKNFDTSIFYNLYKIWIENSVKKIICDDVFVYIQNNKIIGFLTVRYQNESSIIGLIGVDENYRGLGVGSKLISRVIEQAIENNISCVYVDTQKDNKKACRFYEKNNFTVDKEQYVYHYWNKHD